jgi:hypothetical protein
MQPQFLNAEIFTPHDFTESCKSCRIKQKYVVGKVNYTEKKMHLVLSLNPAG